MKEWTIFVAALGSALGRIAFVHKKYTDAERWYGDLVARLADSHFAAEAMCWRAVADYKATNITRRWTKSPRNFGAPTRLAVRRARQFHGCIKNEAESSPKSDWLRIKSVNRVFALTLTVHPIEVCRRMCRTLRADTRQYGLFRYFDKVLPCGLGCGQVIDFRWCSLRFNLLRCDNS
jgi:hypothetical protein